MSNRMIVCVLSVFLLWVGLLGCADPQDTTSRSPSPKSRQAQIDVLEKTPAVPMAVFAGEEEPHSNSGPEAIPQDPSSPATASHPASSNPSRNWPRFRGPRGDGLSRDTGLPVEWSADKNLIWKTELPGPGSSSPITYGDHVYLTCYSGYGVDANAPGNKKELRRHLVCLRRDDGRILWTADLPASGDEAPFKDIALQLHGYATHTPAADAAGVYVFYGATGAAAYTHAGELRWHVDCGSGNHQWGSSSSVVLYKDLVLVNAQIEDRALIALSKPTGKVVWRHHSDNPWHTPALISFNDSEELVLNASTQKRVYGIDPKTGGELWSARTPFIWNIPATAGRNGAIYITDGGGSGKTVAIQCGGRGNVTSTHKLWEVAIGSRLSSPVCYDHFLYLVKGEGNIVCCIDCREGSIVYQERLRPRSGRIYASPIIADGKLYYLSRENGVYVLPAKPQFSLLAHNTIATDASAFNASPAVSRGQLLLRSNKFLYCIGTGKSW